MTNYKDIVRPRDINTSDNLDGLFQGLLIDWIMMELVICMTINYFKKDDEWVGLEFDEFQENIISVLDARRLKCLLEELVKWGYFGYSGGKYFIEDSLIKLISDRGFVIDYVIE